MVGSAECAMYLYMILNHLTKLRHAAHLNLPFVVRRDVLRRNAPPVTARVACSRESIAGLNAPLEGLSKFGVTLYMSPRSMDNLDPYGSDRQCI